MTAFPCESYYAQLNKYNERDKTDKEIEKRDKRIEKLEATLRDVVVTLNSEEIPYMVRNRYACAVAEEVLNE